MKMTIEEIVNKYRHMASPLIGILLSHTIDEEIVRIMYANDRKALIIKRNEYIQGKGYESIFIPFSQEVEIDIDGGFDITYNNEQVNVLILVPLINTSIEV